MANHPTPKKISLFSATALSATAMVGSGWLFSAQLNAQLSGNYSFLAWLLAAMLVMAVGLCLSQVVSVYPVRGATTRSSALSHNSIFGMPFAFANWFGVMMVVATEAQATTEYLSSAINSTDLMGAHGLTFHGKLFALGILFLYLVINFYGIKLLAKINNIMTALKVFTPLFTIVLLILARFDKTNFDLPANSFYHAGSVFSAIIGAGLIYSYNGFQVAVAFASEITKPRRNVPLAIVISITIVMFLYMALQLAFMGAVPHSMLENGWASLNFHSPLVNLALLLSLNFLMMILVADSVISPSGTGYTYLGATSRMFYAMAVEGQMPRWTISKLDPVYNLCRRSLLINWSMIAVVLWNSESWSSLMVAVTGCHVIGYMAAPVSMGAIKPKTKIVGAVVFMVLGFIMTTLPSHDLLLMNFFFIVLMVIYGGVQMVKKAKLRTIILLILPFMIYLWLLYFYQNLIYVAAISLLFYFLVTHQKFVLFCQKNKTDALSLDDDFGH